MLHLNLFTESDEGSKSFLPIEEKGTGIHIHIEDSVLNALLERVPWAEVIESLTNKLSRVEETKHIQEHIYKLGKTQNVFNHKNWHNWKQNMEGFDHQRLACVTFHRSSSAFHKDMQFLILILKLGLKKLLPGHLYGPYEDSWIK